jgi:hypothetical protein
MIYSDHSLRSPCNDVLISLESVLKRLRTGEPTKPEIWFKEDDMFQYVFNVSLTAPVLNQRAL